MFPQSAEAGQSLTVLNGFTGQLAYLERSNGEEVLVRIVSATPDTLLVQRGGIDTKFSVTEVKRISLPGRDSLKNGTLIGAGAGAFLGAFSCQGGTEHCSIAGATIAGAVVFGAIGAWIDHRRKGRLVVYRR
jgi:hypothetical protein